jgi:large subunit ribosomal protein L21
MYALVEIKGHQFKAEKGAVLQIDRVNAETGSALEFETVLLVSNDKGVQIGAPYVQGAKVKATISGTCRGEKVISYKYKRRKSYHRTVGNRALYTTIKVEDIVLA